MDFLLFFFLVFIDARSVSSLSFITSLSTHSAVVDMLYLMDWKTSAAVVATAAEEVDALAPNIALLSSADLEDISFASLIFLYLQTA